MVPFRRSFLLAILLFPLMAQDPDEALRRLASRIAQSAQGPVVLLPLRNFSSLTGAQIQVLARSLEHALEQRGAHAGAGVKTSVTLAETSRGYLWIAEIAKTSEPAVLMEEMTRAPDAVPPARLIIDRQLIFEQAEPILDFAFSEPQLLVLEPGRIALFRRETLGWDLERSLPIPVAHAWPRDVRGRLTTETDSYVAYLPGTTCSGAIRPQLTLECRDATPWPVEANRPSGRAEFSSSRNFFSGHVSTAFGRENDVPPFFSVATVEGRGSMQWVFAGVDGVVRLYDSSLAPAGEWPAWGSDIAAVSSTCGSGAQILVSRQGDAAAGDAVQSFEVSGGQQASAGPAIEFAGPVTALWPAGQASARAVVRDARTGKYAAFHLAISCRP